MVNLSSEGNFWKKKGGDAVGLIHLVFFGKTTLPLPPGWQIGQSYADLVQAAVSLTGKEAGREPGAGVDGGEKEVYLINALNFYRTCPLWKKEPEKLLLRQLCQLRQAVREAEGEGEYKILLPPEKNRDQELLIQLMGQGFYDFWFTDSLNESSLGLVLEERRSFRELEAYLETLPLPEAAPPAKSWREQTQRWLTEAEKRLRLKGLGKGGASFKKEDRPDLLPSFEAPLVKKEDRTVFSFFASEGKKKETAVRKLWMAKDGSSSAFFYSRDDSLLIYAAALLTALQLAEEGAPVLLLELPGSGSRLATALGLRHPRRNLRCFLEEFSEKQEPDFDAYAFTGPELAKDPQSFDPPEAARRYPSCLTILPDDHTPAGIRPLWESFLAAWLQWALVERNFAFLFFVGFGEEAWQNIGGRPPGRQTILAVQPWPDSLNYAVREQTRLGERGLVLLEEKGTAAAKRELREGETRWLTVESGAVEDFIALISFQSRPGSYSEASCRLVREIAEFLKNRETGGK